MTFSQSTVSQSTAVGSRPSATFYGYTNMLDTDNDCKQPGYFARNPRFDFRPGDKIMATLKNGFFILEVASDTSTAIAARQVVGDNVLLTTTSALTAQEPAGLDTPLVIDFGGPVGLDSDPIQLLANQRLRANVDLPSMRARVRLQAGRLSVPMTANMYFRTLVNGVQTDSSLFIQMPDNVQSYPVYITAWFGLAAGQEVWFEMIRDSSGNDSGGLYSTNPVTAGWNDSTTTFLQISEAVLD